MISAVCHGAMAQPADEPASAGPVVRGIYNWVHSTGNAEAAFDFYAEVFGLELARSRFAGPATSTTPPPRILPVAEARSDRLVWDLTDTEGSRFRTVFMHAPNTPFGLELSEFFDIERTERTVNAWDPGASMLIFEVRDLATVMQRLAGVDASPVTLGAQPVATPAGRAVLVRDPDGYPVMAVQATREAIGRAAPGDVIRTSIGIAVADTQAALAFYEGLLGFEAGATRTATPAELQLYGLADGRLEQTRTTIPGTAVAVVINAFELPATATPPHPVGWKFQDPGSPQFQLEVTGLDALLVRTRNAGYDFLSAGGRPIQRAFGRFVFVIDDDGIFVEFVEPAASGDSP